MPLAAGVLFVSRSPQSGPVLLLKRALTEENFGGYWSLPGGKIDDGEAPADAAARECNEEIGYEPGVDDLEEITANDKFVTFRCYVDGEFTPFLNPEHIDYRWCALNDLPRPLHPGVAAMLDGLGDATMVGDKAGGFYALAMDRAEPLGPFSTQELAERAAALIANPKPAGLAYDKSARAYDVDGRLHLDLCHISKACVSPYRGREIPDFEKLGLNGEKIYQLLRDPAELEKAAPTFNGIPVMFEHVPVSADDHQPDLIVGATGTHATFNAPYLDNALVIWPQYAIDGIEKSVQKELSCGYRYSPDMTPGTYDGVAYDGVMRNIIGNHVALVKEGRAGPDVVIGDSAINLLEELLMPTKTAVLSRTAVRIQGALIGHLSPKMALDAKPLDLSAILAKVTRKNLMAADGKMKPDAAALIVKLAKDAVEPLLAPEAKAAGGAGPDDVMLKLIEHAFEAGASEAPSLDVPAVVDPAAEGETGDPADPEPKGKKSLAEVLKARGMTDDDISAIESEMGEGDPDAMDEDEEERKKKEAMDKAAKDADLKVGKTAMDAAIKTAVQEAETRVKADLRAVQEARDFVRPLVGEVSMTFDSADGVYRAACGSLGIDVTKVKDTEALKIILGNAPKPRATTDNVIALDAAASKSLAERFPHAARINITAA